MMQVESGTIIVRITASFDKCALEGLLDGGIDVLFGQELFDWRVGSQCGITFFKSPVYKIYSQLVNEV